MITGILDDPKRLAALRRNADAMRQLLADCRLIHHGLAKVWADEWRDRDRAAERVNDAMYRGVIEARELERLIDRPVPALSIPANDPGTTASSVMPIRFNDPDDEENELIGQWAQKGSTRSYRCAG